MLWGVARVGSLVGIQGTPWMLASDLIDRHRRQLVVQPRKYLPKMLDSFAILTNYVDARNHASLRWLARWGFRISKPRPHGPDGLPFHLAELRREWLNV